LGGLLSGLNIAHYLMHSECCASWGTVQRICVN